MIKSIHGNGYIMVSGPSYSMPWIDSTRPSAGMVRYKDYQFEVYDGNTWHPAVASAPTIELSQEANMLLNWVKTKIQEDEYLLTLPSEHPAVNAAKANINRIKKELKDAENQLKATMILSEEQ